MSNLNEPFKLLLVGNLKMYIDENIENKNFLNIRLILNTANIMDIDLSLNYDIGEPFNPFIHAVENSSLEVVELLYRNVKDINVKDEKGETALFKAIICEKIKIIDFLFQDKQLDPFIRNIDNKNALELALISRRYYIFNYADLIKNRFEDKINLINSYLLDRDKYQFEDLKEFLNKQKNELNDELINDTIRIPYLLKFKELFSLKKENELRDLINTFALLNINFIDNYVISENENLNIFMYCCSNDYDDFQFNIVKDLYDTIKTINFRDTKGNTPLILVIKIKNYKLAKFLTELNYSDDNHDFDKHNYINLQDNDGNTALMIILKNMNNDKDEQMIQYLLTIKDLNKNIKNIENKSARNYLVKAEADKYINTIFNNKNENLEKANVNDYIPISNAKELKSIEKNLKGKYILINDIDLDNKSFIPIGENINHNKNEDQDAGFKGIFNGNGYIIKNLRIDRKTDYDNSYCGLFSVINGATIKNLSLINAYVYSNKFCVGILSGASYKSTIENCFVTGIAISDQNCIGGISGYSSLSNILNSYTIVKLKGNSFIGGLIGYNINSIVEKNYSMPKIEGSNYLGSLIGITQKSDLTYNYSNSVMSLTGSSNDTNNIMFFDNKLEKDNYVLPEGFDNKIWIKEIGYYPFLIRFSIDIQMSEQKNLL